MPTHRFKNGGEQPVTVWLEPYCDEIEVPPGSTLSIDYTLAPGEEDETFIEHRPDRIIYWCSGVYIVEMDGRRVPTH